MTAHVLACVPCKACQNSQGFITSFYKHCVGDGTFPQTSLTHGETEAHFRPHLQLTAELFRHLAFFSAQVWPACVLSPGFGGKPQRSSSVSLSSSYPWFSDHICPGRAELQAMRERLHIVQNSTLLCIQELQLPGHNSQVYARHEGVVCAWILCSLLRVSHYSAQNSASISGAWWGSAALKQPLSALAQWL